ncbi:MAG: hypothetical protein ABIY90_00760 [Puia sp.]
MWVPLGFVETYKTLGKGQGGKNADDEYFDLLADTKLLVSVFRMIGAIRASRVRLKSFYSVWLAPDHIRTA